MRQSVLAGLPIIAIGVLVTAIAVTYPVGTPARMGPGFFPLACGILLLVMGVAIALFDHESLDGLASANIARPAAAVFAGLVAWTLTIGFLGLVPATFLMVFLVSYAQARPNWMASLVTACVLSLMGVIVFIMGLNIRLSAFGAW